MADREWSFGGAIRDALDRIGKSQSWLAGEVGVYPAAVTHWVQGSSLPKGDQMVRLPHILGVSGHWLLTGDGPMLPAQDLDATKLEVRPCGHASSTKYTMPTNGTRSILAWEGGQKFDHFHWAGRFRQPPPSRADRKPDFAHHAARV